MEGSTINRLTSMAVFLLFLLILVLAVSNSLHGHGSGAAPAPSLVVVALRGHSPDDKTSVAVQRCDLSFAGFTKGRGHWQAFPGLEQLFPASTTLPFGSSYTELIGGLANLPGVPLGREAMMQAVRVLSTYRPGASAQRLEPIRKAIDDGWDTGARVAPENLPYIEHWDTMSYEILRSNRTGKWDGPFTKMLETQANIRSKEEAVAVMNMLVDATSGKCSRLTPFRST